MTEVVVDAFEIVEIDEADREPKAIAGAAIDLAVELVRCRIVGQAAGETVSACEQLVPGLSRR